MEEIINYVVENIHDVIASSAVVLAAGYGLYRYFRKKSKKEDRLDNENIINEPILINYIADIIKRSSILSFGDPSYLEKSSKTKQDGIISIEQLWVPLRVANSLKRTTKQGSHDNMTETDNGQDLISFFEDTNDSAIILGEPGSGKSTSLAKFTLTSAKKYNMLEENKLPIWINLSEVKSISSKNDIDVLLSGVPELDIAKRRLGEKGYSNLKKELTEHIINGKALLLLDGLDEVKEFHLQAVRNTISKLYSLNTGSRVFVSCRVFDYQQSNPNRKLPIKGELELLPYDQNQQKQYVDNWYEAAILTGRFTIEQAESLKGALIVELKHDNITEIASSPLLLTLLTIIHSEEAKLPDTRAVLCDKAISYMLADSAKWRIREAGVSVTASPPVLSLAVEIAYYLHVKEESENNETTHISKDEIISLAIKICDDLNAADTGRSAPSENELANRFLNSHGLLLNVGPNLYRFSHRSFQEYLAGQYFIVGAKINKALSNSKSKHWIEPFKLMASFSGHDGSNLYFILELIKELIEIQNIHSHQLAGEMLTEIGKRRLALHKFSHIFQSEDGMWNTLIKNTLNHLNNNSLDIIGRDRSCQLLSKLGDPRFDDFFPQLILLSKKQVIVGTKSLNIDLIEESGANFGEPRELNFYEFSIGKYLVTNKDFKRFIDDNGYTNEDYWNGKFARGWIKGEQKVLEEVRNHWLSTLEHHHAKELRDGEINSTFIDEESLLRTQPRQGPFYWNDRRFNQSNQPVVGINFWEAKAFCNWLTDKSIKQGLISETHKFDLPTEFEWERASRPKNDDRKYPWGNEWKEEMGHVSTNLLNIRKPTPVGVYKPPFKGCPCDLIGNVWEWTDSIYLKYDENCDSLRFDSDSLEERVVRGSSWYNTSTVAACSVRAVDRSYNIFYDVGFRIVCVDKSLTRK